MLTTVLACGLAVAAQAGAANLLVDVDAAGEFTRTRAGTVVITAENAGEITLDDVALIVEVDSDDVGVGVNPACDESDDGATQTITCAIGALQRRSSVAIDVSLVPNVDGEISVRLRGTTSTPGEDPAGNEVEALFPVAVLVLDDGSDDDDDPGGCNAAASATNAAPGSFAALALLLVLRVSVSRRVGRPSSRRR